MNITLTGASGFIGNPLIARLKANGHQLSLLGRNPPKDPSLVFSKWDAMGAAPPPAEAIAGADAIIHMAGEPVGQRWSDDVKKRIRDSRVNGTNRLVEAIAAAGDRKPKILVAASAIGYYGNRGDDTLNEASKPGKGFLPEVCVAWENAVLAAAQLGLRVAFVRIGIVLGKDGGALAQMLPFFKMGAGGRVGNGRQWMSWIHVDDLVRMFVFALESELCGAINGTAPNPATNADFTHVLGEVLHRPAALPVPEFAVKLMYGEMAQLVIEGQRVLPAVAVQAGFQFQFPELRSALTEAVS